MTEQVAEIRGKWIQLGYLKMCISRLILIHFYPGEQTGSNIWKKAEIVFWLDGGPTSFSIYEDEPQFEDFKALYDNINVHTEREP